MKKFPIVSMLAAAAGCAVIFSGCAGCAGCGGSVQNVAAMSSNWYSNTAFKKIQPTFTQGDDKFRMEELTYKVTFDSSTAGNKNYSVNYSDGTYKTYFYAAKFDKSVITEEDFKEGYPDNLTAYYYKTELDIPQVTFTYGEEKKSFEGDKCFTECWFLPVENYLRPLYSKTFIKSTTPAEYQVSSIDETYREIAITYTSFYNYDGTAVRTAVNYNGAQSTKNLGGLNKADNSYFDVSSLDIAVRATKLSSALSQAISIYTPAGGLDNYTLQGSDAALKDDEVKQVSTALAAQGLYKPVKTESGEDKLNTVSVKLSVSANLTGVSQTYWFAAIDNPRNNTPRATMLKLSIPLNYSLGTLNYVLEKVDSTLYLG